MLPRAGKAKPFKHSLLDRGRVVAHAKHLSAFAVIVVVIVLAVFLTGASAQSSGQSNSGYPFLTAPVYEASSASQFKVNVAYAYYGDTPGNQTASAVFLNFTRLPGVQITGCDAIVELYGVKITKDVGQTEYYAYFIGTNYTDVAAFSHEENSVNNVNELANINLYSSLSGSFSDNWTAGTSVLSPHIGSIAFISENPPTRALGVWSGGKPKSVSVTVYRIGYETITNSSFTLYNDTAPFVVTTAGLSEYGNGFLFNQMVPASLLPETNLFYPPTDLASQASSVPATPTVPEFSISGFLIVLALSGVGIASLVHFKLKRNPIP
jgi:hypothetical protein